MSTSAAHLPLQDNAGRWKYQGGDTYLESVPVTWKYSDFVFRLVEKTGEAVAVKYMLPGEDMDPDSLITVTDDDDLQVSCAPLHPLPPAECIQLQQLLRHACGSTPA